MMSCILCGKKEFEKVADKVRDSDNHSVIKCAGCGHVQLTPLPTSDDSREFYDKNQPALSINAPMGMEELRDVQEYDTNRRVKLFTKTFSKSSRILDIGSGRGFFLGKMFELGYDITGVEISQQMRSVSQQVSSAPLLNVNLLEEPSDIGTFDVIVLFHLLEHFTNPISACSALGKYLNKSGYLVMEVPNLDDLMLKCEPYREFWWQQAHISYFNYVTLFKVLKDAGYYAITIKGTQRYGLENMINWYTIGKPQLSSPSYETDGEYKWLETYYKQHLESTLQCDTLIAMSKKRESNGNKSSGNRNKS